MSVTDFAEMLLSGPRGRRLLLEYALECESTEHPVRDSDSLGHALAVADGNNEHSGAQGNALLGDVPNNHLGASFVVSLEDIDIRLDGVDLHPPTPQSLREALAAAVDLSEPWQAPGGVDVIAERADVMRALRRVARVIASSAHADWWGTPLDAPSQRSVQWDGKPPTPALRDGDGDRDRLGRSQGGRWFSRPPENVPSSSRMIFDGSPAGLWFVEEGLGWDSAESVALHPFEDVRVCEIATSADWVNLCIQFPRDVTSEMRGTWIDANADASRWIVPDWGRVAEQYDGVHLQVGAYVAVSGEPILVKESPRIASAITGWNPDETFWLTAKFSYGAERTRWQLVEDGATMTWQPAPPSLM